MNIRILTALALIAAPAAAVAMPVSTFLAKADALKAKGPLALFSGDYKLLTRLVKADAAALGAENKAAEAAHRPKAYCAPSGGIGMGQAEVMAAMTAVPVPRRAATDSKAALRDWLARRYPCPAS